MAFNPNALNGEVLNDARDKIDTGIEEARRAAQPYGYGNTVGGLADAVAAVDQAARDTIDADNLTDPDGSLGHTPFEYRQQERDEAVTDALARVESASVVAADLAKVATATLEAATLPSDEPIGDWQRTADEVRMMLDAVPNNGLSSAMILLLDEHADDDTDEARLLASSWGRRYAASRGQATAHDAVIAVLRSRAAERGGKAQQKAAKALAAFNEHQAPALVNEAVKTAQMRVRHVRKPRPPLTPRGAAPARRSGR